MPRVFDPDEHIRNLFGEQSVMYDDEGHEVADVRGVSGARAQMSSGLAIGVDRIVMKTGSAFPLHTHKGDHLLYILSGSGMLNIDGRNYHLSAGDSVFVPAEYPHGVAGPKEGPPLEIIAFGVPHHTVGSLTRMTVVRPTRSAGRAQHNSFHR